MSIGVVIRDGRPEEVEAIARVNVQAWRETYSGLVSDELLAGIFEERKSVRQRCQGVIILRSRARSAALPWIQFFKLQ